MQRLIALALVALAQPHAAMEHRQVAVCFVGQFPRHGRLDRPISDILGNASYDAFIAASTQHSETDPSDVVSEAAVCENLQSQGFGNCRADLIPYDGSVFVDAVKGLDRFQMRNGLYPHRLASFFHTIQRCLRTVRKASKDTCAKLPTAAAMLGARRATCGYQSIVVTRLDVISLVHPKGFPDAGWWKRADSFGMVGRMVSKRKLIDDKLFFGEHRKASGLECDELPGSASFAGIPVVVSDA